MRLNVPAARLAFALCLVTTAVNLQAPLYTAYAREGGHGVTATTVAFSFYVVGILPVLLALGGLSDRVGRRPLVLLALGLSMAATVLMLLWPHLETLALARWLLGTGTALTSAIAPAYMAEFFDGRDARLPANWVTASTSLGFGLGAALTSVCLLISESLRPASFWLHLLFATAAIAMVRRLPECSPREAGSPMLRLPFYPPGALPFGLAILLSWATVGLVIAVLPSALAAHDLARWSGFSTFAVISCGLLFQPLARRLEATESTRLGLLILPPAYTLLAWGALHGSLPAVLSGAVAASSACYGFVYLGGLSGVVARAAGQTARASAGFFLLAYVGFSLPVISTGVLIDLYGRGMAFSIFGIALLAGTSVLRWHLGGSQTAPAPLKQPSLLPASATPDPSGGPRL